MPQLNTELLQGQMRLRAKVVTTTQHWLSTTQTSTSATSARCGAVLLKIATTEDREGAKAWRGPSWAWTRTSHPHSKCTNQSCGHCSRRPRQQANASPSAQLSSLSTTLRFAHPPLSRGVRIKETYAWYYGTCTGVV